VDRATASPRNNSPTFRRIRTLAVLLTLVGIGLFGYFIYAVGFEEIVNGIGRFGIAGFGVILAIYFVRLCLRSYAWTLSVHEPDALRMQDALPAVVIGEALSSTIPLGILISGTSKAIVVRKRLPLVAGLSSVATENLFYSLVTGIFLIFGSGVLIRQFGLDSDLRFAIDMLIAALGVLIILGVVMVIRQWHFASATVGWLYRAGLLHERLAPFRDEVRRFEDLIYGFYRRYPRRFLPICGLEALYHVLGIAEIWFILFRLGETLTTPLNAFLLESVSRLVTILFKLVPFVVGVDEAGAQFVGETVGLGAGVAVTLAIIRKGRMLVWTAIGAVLIAKRGLSAEHVSQALDRERDA
jgi:hypothetical protein